MSGEAQGWLFEVAPIDDLEAIDSEPARDFARELRGFEEFGASTRRDWTRSRSGAADLPTYRNEFWTAAQRQANSLHEVSYRACFKPALPRFFIERLSRPGDVVLDPFAGRGTTSLEAALLGRVPYSVDVNPLSAMLLSPRLDPPDGLEQIAQRLADIELEVPGDPEAALESSGVESSGPESSDAFAGTSLDDLLCFFHPRTLAQLVRLRSYLLQRAREDRLDALDAWVRMVAVGRLTGHSPGFFSVYTLPPNQATTASAQRKINARRGQRPEERDIASRILRKSAALLAGVDEEVRAQLATVRESARLATEDAARLEAIPAASVHLVVTSPPFLDVVNYAADNWLRCWFCGIDPAGVAITKTGRLDDWSDSMTESLRACHRVLVPGGHVAFEVGEVRGGTEQLERTVIDCALAAGLRPEFVLLQDQQFTKTANCWGVANNQRGTNTQRVVVMTRQD